MRTRATERRLKAAEAAAGGGDEDEAVKWVRLNEFLKAHVERREGPKGPLPERWLSRSVKYVQRHEKALAAGESEERARELAAIEAE